MDQTRRTAVKYLAVRLLDDRLGNREVWVLLSIWGVISLGHLSRTPGRYEIWEGLRVRGKDF